MKLRIDGATLRLRLSPDDVRRLARDGAVTDTMPVGPGAALTLVLAADDALGVTLADHVLTVSVPRAPSERWSAGDDAPLDGTVDAGDGRTLAVRVEPDGACRHGGDG